MFKLTRHQKHMEASISKPTTDLYAGGGGKWGMWGGGRESMRGVGWGSHTPSWQNYFKIMQFFTRNWVFNPNFGLKVRIFLRFTSGFIKFLIFAPPFSKVCIRACTHTVPDQFLRKLCGRAGRGLQLGTSGFAVTHAANCPIRPTYSYRNNPLVYIGRMPRSAKQADLEISLDNPWSFFKHCLQNLSRF